MTVAWTSDPLDRAARQPCSSCQGPMVWAVMEKSGRRIPLDPDPRDDGNLAVAKVSRSGIPLMVHAGNMPDGFDGERYVTHFATCPDADQHRR